MGLTSMREPLSATLGKIAGALRWRYLGLGFLWAWLYCSYGTSALFENRAGVSINADASWLVSAVTVVLAFLVGGFVLARLRVGALALLRVLAPGALALGTVVSALGGLPLEMNMWAGGVLTGAGYALTSILWAQALQRLDVEELEVAIPVSSAVIIPCALLFPHLGGTVGVVATAALPVISGLLLCLCVREGADGDAALASPSTCGGEEGRTELFPENCDAHRMGDWLPPRCWWGYLGRAGAALCVLYLVMGFHSAIVGPYDSVQGLVGHDVATMASPLATLALGVSLVLFSRQVGFTSLFHWVMPVAIVALVVMGCPAVGADFLSSFIVDTCDSLVQVLIYLFVLTMAKKGIVAASCGVGVANGMVQTGVLLGNVLGCACVSGTTACSMGEAVAWLVCLTALGAAVAPSREPASELPALSPHADAIEQSLVDACAALQERFGLSERETEVAFLLAQGRSRPYIREKLFISKNTVATHIKHIYGKMGIHSREELIDVVSEISHRR